MATKYSPTEKMMLDIGFSQKEALVYMTILTLGRGSVSQITRKAEINRTTGYNILDNLVAKGLISISGKEPKQEYIAEPPETLKKYIEKEIEERKENLTTLDTLLPELKLIHNTNSRPKVMFYEGTAGLQEVFDDTLTARGPIVAFANYETAHPVLPQYFANYYKRRSTAKISARGIVLDTPMATERKAQNKEEMRDLALIPKEKFMFSPGIEIYDNKVMIASWKEKLGIIIESGEIAEAMKKIFELAWAEARRLDSGQTKRLDAKN